MTLERNNIFLKSLNNKLKIPTLDIDLSSEDIVSTVTEWNELHPSLLKQYPMRKIIHISRHTITQLLKKIIKKKK